MSDLKEGPSVWRLKDVSNDIILWNTAVFQRLYIGNRNYSIKLAYLHEQYFLQAPGGRGGREKNVKFTALSFQAYLSIDPVDLIRRR